MSKITVEYCGRYDDDYKVIGASSREEAREAALKFHNKECDESGFILDDGHLITWGYEEPQPDEWVDYYLFRVYDEAPLPTEYYDY